MKYTTYAHSVSIVVPVRNGAATLERCLSSLEALNYPQDKLERIMVNDGSTDLSGDIGERYGLRVLYQSYQGVGAARNAGARAARGEFVAFIDADDVVVPEWLESGVERLEEAPEVAVVGCNHFLLNDEVNTFISLNFLEKQYRLKRASLLVAHVGSSGCVMRRKALLEVGGFATGLPAAEDSEVCDRLRRHGYGLLLNQDQLIGVSYPSGIRSYFRNQIRNSAHLFLLAVRRSGRYRSQRGYTGLAEYIQSILPSVTLLGVGLSQSILTSLIAVASFLLALLVVNSAFLKFVLRQRERRRRLWWFGILVFLVVRAATWNVGLLYGAWLVVCGRSFQVRQSADGLDGWTG
jgi:cellulose synthase/poly-beta-1,6-N-acetylglucosamine synthase-like glycosyltransferase